MAKKEENIRKRSNDYRKDHVDAELKLKGIEARIIERTLNLCKAYPDVLIDDLPHKYYYAGDYLRLIPTTKYLKANTRKLLDIMRIIEEHIDSLHPHQQGELFGDKFLSSHPSNPDAIL